MPRYTNAQIGAALTETKGMLFLAAKTLGCSPNTVRDRLAKHDTLRDLQQALRGETVDTAELKLYTAILAGQPWAIQFYLRTQGKDRGYTETTEVSGPSGGPIKHEFRNVTAEAIAEAALALKAAGVVVEDVPYQVSEGQQNGVAHD